MKAAFLYLWCALVAAQTMDRTHPPPPGPARPFKLPPVTETRLANGLTVVLVQDDRVPLITVRLAFRCGNRRDPQDLPGVASAVGELLTQATKSRGFIQIGEAIDNMGGALTASSGADLVSIGGSTLPEHAPVLLEIISDVARNAEFTDIDLRLYRQNRKQNLARQFAQPGYVANQAFRNAIFGEHPYAHVAPTMDSLDRMTRQHLVSYRDTWLVPNNAFLIILGKLPARADMLKVITDQFGAWAMKALPEVPVTPVPKAAKRLILVDRPGAVQADIRMGRIAATQRDPDYFAEMAGSLIVGSVPMGRMFQDLRENHGLVYDVRTEPLAFDEAGILATITQVRDEAVGEALKSLLAHLDRMASETVTGRELMEAKGSAAGRFLLHLETQAGLADELMVGRIQGLPLNYLETWRGRMEAVTAEEIQTAAKRFFASTETAVVVVGDAAKIRSQLDAAVAPGKFEIVKAAQ